MKKIALICGSLRKQSYNKALLVHIQENYQESASMEVVDISGFPLFNEDIEFEPIEAVVKAKASIAQSDAVIIVSPEYNHSVPGVLKNALDWFSREGRVMKDKPVLVIGCSNGKVGTARGQSHLRQILNAPGIQALPLPSNELLIDFAQTKFDEEGRLIDEKTATFIERRMKRFAEWMEVSEQWGDHS